MKQKDLVRSVLKEARKQGFEHDVDGRHHHRVYHPNTPGEVVRLPSSPGDYRGMRNAISKMRRDLGFKWHGR